MKLIIAEKPDLGKAIAEALPGRAQSKTGYIEKGDYCITWAFGHLLQLKDPEDYNNEYETWKLDHLPIFFENWEQKIKETKIKKTDKEEQKQLKERYNKGTKAQVEIIKTLLNTCNEVIHAGDPDDEGQLLIDEILDFFKNKKIVKRLLVNDNNPEAIKKSFEKLESNEKFIPLGRAAYARAVSDFIVGINATRFYTLHNKAGVLSVGRVQSPTLQMIVNRDISIENHEKSFYYELFVTFEIEKKSNKNEVEELKKIAFLYNNEFLNETKRAKYKEEILNEFTRLDEKISISFKYYPSKETLSFFQNNKITDKTVFKNLNDIIHKLNKVTINKEIKKEEAPLPFNLLKLQVYANNKWGYSPDQTLTITQTLREKYKAITYNRSDSQYLNIEHHKEASEVINKVLENLKIIVPNIDYNLTSKCFDNSKVTAHHAIIPTKTSVNISTFTEEEKNIYTIISNFYIAQFLPNLIKENTIATTLILEEEKLISTSTKILDYGFKFLLNDKSEEEEKTSNLSKLYGGDYEIEFLSDEIKEKETTAPKRYTEATLLQDMSSIAKYCNKETQKILKEKDSEKKGENGGIGTPATRSTIINDFYKKGYCEKKGKNIISTQKAREFIKMLPDELKNADTTANWYLIQEEIKEGISQPTKLISNVLETIKTIISNTPIKINYSSIEISQKEVLGKCPKCGGDIYEGADKEKKINYYCSNYKIKNCSFKMREEMKHFSNNLKITKTKLKNLLSGKKTTFKLLGKDKKEYEVYLKIKINGNFINFENDGYPPKKK